MSSVDRLVNKSIKRLSKDEKLTILNEYPPMGNVDDWIEWVLDSRRRGLCPYNNLCY